MIRDTIGWRITATSDNVVFLVGFGLWDSSVVTEFCTEYRELVGKFAEKPWGILLDASDWELNDRSVQNALRDQNRWVVDHGCRAGCAYTGPGALNRLLLYRLAEPDREDYRFRVYPQRSRAVQALIDSGFRVTDNQLERFFRGEGTRP